jgi:hypothetical protein
MRCQLVLIATVSAMAMSVARADEVHHGNFAAAVQGTWAPSADACKAKDKSTIVITETKYTDADITCTVDTVVERAGVPSVYYAARSLCPDAAQPDKTRAINVILRPEGGDKLSIGMSFDAMKVYQRCPAQ